jgi:chromosome segregation ATPase
MLLGAALAGAEGPGADSQMLAEVRQLRQDLQTAAATIQRVQIVMFRLQVQGAVLEGARQRLETARSWCSQAPLQRQMALSQMDEAQARKRNAQNPTEQQSAEALLTLLNSQIEMAAKQEQDCQAPRAEAENEFRNEDAKMNELQEQLDRLDKALAGDGRK